MQTFISILSATWWDASMIFTNNGSMALYHHMYQDTMEFLVYHHFSKVILYMSAVMNNDYSTMNINARILCILDFTEEVHRNRQISDATYSLQVSSSKSQLKHKNTCTVTPG